MSEALHTELGPVPTERLEAEVQELAGHLAAATCRWLLMVAELDRREAWRSWEVASMAHWLSWKCGLSLATGRDHVRVARALEPLAEVREHFATGRLSYSKVRALCRLVTTPEMEHDLVELAMVATAAQLDRISAGCGRARRFADPECDTRNHEERNWSLVIDDDGMGELRVRAPSHMLASLTRAVDAIVEREVPPDTPAPARRVDALEALALHYLQPDSEQPEPTALVAHFEAPAHAGDVEQPARVHGIPVSRAAVERMRCDGDHATERPGAGGGIERSPFTAQIPRRIRRAVRRRDANTCRWPGCTNRAHLHVHHIVFRSRRGEHTVRNLILLCPHHHRRVHHGSWTLIGDANGCLQFTGPDGRTFTEMELAEELKRRSCSPYEIARRNRNAGNRVDPSTIATAHNEPLHLNWTVANILELEAVRLGRT